MTQAFNLSQLANGVDTSGLLDLSTNSKNPTWSANVTGYAFIPSSSTVPTNGLFLPAANTVALSTGTTERMRVDSSGRLLVKMTSAPTVGDAQYALVSITGSSAGATTDSFFSLLRGQAPSAISSGAGLGTIVFGANDGSPYATIMGNTDGTGGASDYPGRLVFSTTADGASSPTERARIPAAGGFQCVNSISVGNATPTTSGAGITFPATQSASTDANTLDDYEEGTWTPSLGGNTTYNTQTGRYTKIGRMVYVSCYLYINQIGTGSTTTITGLPFNISGTQDAECCFSVAYTNPSIATSVISFTVYVLSSTIYIKSRTVAAKEASENAIFANSAVVEVAGWYQAG